MATSVTKTLTITYSNADTYMEKESGSVKVKGLIVTDAKVYYIYQSNASGTAKLKPTALTALYPTATAKPYRMDHAHSAGTSKSGTAFYLGLNIDGAAVFKDYPSSLLGETISHDNLTLSAITNSSRNSTWQFTAGTGSGSILIQGSVSSAKETITLYFYKYACSAVGVGVGIASATVSDPEPYQGDSVTFMATLINNASFDGWYRDPECTQLVSTSLSYTTAATDITLYAKATATAETLTVTLGTNQLLCDTVYGDVLVRYSGGIIATLTCPAEKTLLCQGLVATTDISIGNRTLRCGGKTLPQNIVVKLE